MNRSLFFPKIVLFLSPILFFTFASIDYSQASDRPTLSLNNLIDSTGTYSVNDQISTNIAHDALSRRGNTGKAIAYSIARDILSRYKRFNGGGAWNTFINTMMQDHAGLNDEDASGVSPNASYFRTNSRRELEEIIEKTLRDPDDYTFYAGRNCELEISRTFSKQEVQAIIGHKNLGKFKGQDQYLNKVLVCFGINGVKKDAGKRFWTGPSVMNTTYPVR